MELQVRSVGPVTIVDVSGRFECAGPYGLVKDKVSTLISESRKLIVLNLGGVPYLDSTGLGELAATHAMATRQGARIVLLKLTKRVEDLLALCRLLTVFDTFETEAEAVADLSVLTGV